MKAKATARAKASKGLAVKRALLSCHDKAGLDRFAKGLSALGVELVASGGTAAFLTKHGLKVKTVESFAGIREQLDGRVKTLHPAIHAGILAKRDDASHVKAVGRAGLIDLVVVNLYPFEQTASRAGTTLAQAVEDIDIGGVALLRAAAKNFQHVAVVSRPADYDEVLKGLREGRGRVPAALARRLAAETFRRTSGYDAAIASYLASGGAAPAGVALPDEASVTVRKRQALRYGENPHQQGGWYQASSGPVWGLATLTQLQGKELSYNNLLDADAALRCLLDFDEPTCAIIKHNSQCGLASASDPREAYRLAYACDAESAFGGIVGVNRRIEAALARELTSTFLEVIMAPSVEPEAAALFRKKPNLRVITVDWPQRLPADAEWRQLSGGWLLQQPDTATADLLKLATKRAPSAQERADLLFAWKAAKHVKSNAIVLAKGRATVGIGQGQPSRVGSVRLALERAGAKGGGAVAASDGFFPFPDGVELLAGAGVTAVIQPGGSIRDAEVVAAADRAGMTMLLSGIRHFRH